jgi:BCD family chlorophyll transporter-like MFS transporter
VALLYVFLLLGMLVSSLAFGVLLRDFSQMKLIQVVQGAALLTFVLNGIALWKQEPRQREKTAPGRPRPTFHEAWQTFRGDGRTIRLLVAVGLGTAGFSMQDILLEPYGGEILGLSVSQTTLLTALFAAGTLVGFAISARTLARGHDPYRLAAIGALIGLVAFSAVIFASPLDSGILFRVGVVLIGLGGGLFAVSTLTAIMYLAEESENGIALGAWGAVQASAAGAAIALGGALRDVISGLAEAGKLGEALAQPSTGYGVVYHIEILLLFATMVAVGPLVRPMGEGSTRPSSKFGLAEFPG